MEEHSFKQSLLICSAVTISILLFIDLLVMAFCLRQGDIAERQLLLAQRILFCAGSELGTDAVNIAGQASDAGEKNSLCVWSQMSGLRLLSEGGNFAGQDIPGIDDPEIGLLLDSMITFRQVCEDENSEFEVSSHLASFQQFCRQARTLSDALVFRAIAARERVQTAFQFMVALIVFGLFSGFFGVRVFLAKKRRLQHDKHLFELGSHLLRALPEALVLLDKSLSLKFVNHLAESYFRHLSGSSQKRNFSHYCQDQSLLKKLREFLHEVSPSSCEKVSARPDDVLLQLDNGQKSLVVIQWYKLYLVDENYLLGVLYNPDEDRRRELNIVSAQEQLAELSSNLFRVQDEERQHLAEELHDGLCQSLAALKMQVFGIERHLDKVELQEECRQARQFIAQIIEDTRRLSHDLSPVILDDLGLSNALAHLVNNFTALHNLKASVSVSDIDGLFSLEAARNIYRIVQEAINNIGKHAQASLLILETEIVGDLVSFSIKDDGVGFVVDLAKRSRDGGGLGLASMAQRVQLMGGKFVVDSQLGKGCEIKFTLPKK
ncbi:MAG: sensor histidine kinase [Deltaproteobacteria bacterium]|nr:sensor histidine kinase [Candidatus Tharpella sp.]